jgi:hypothetical protein
MENKKLSYEMLMERLKNKPPVLEHPEQLTRSIMAGIERKAGNKRRFNNMTHIWGTMSGVAAVLLIYLLMYEAVQPPEYRFAIAQNQINSSGQEDGYPVARVEKAENISVIIQKKLEYSISKKQIYAAWSNQKNK